MKTLVIIDMQPRFHASQFERLVENVIKQIKMARRHDWAVVVLEYQNVNGYTREKQDTDFRLKKALENYSKVQYAIKKHDDGSKVVCCVCAKYNFPTNLFRVCGVNTNACIKSTVKGLAALFPESQVEVIQDACNSLSKSDYAWSKVIDVAIDHPNVICRSAKKKKVA